jgi:isopentenyl-diphosphate delta-isomerase
MGIKPGHGHQAMGSPAALPQSTPEDLLILVDGDDREVGTLGKVACHVGDGILHRAFSVFLFNPAGDVLIQQRAAGKMLWPGFWSNSCCSHPRPGEDTTAAAHRRVREELQVECRLEYLYKFQYQARFGTIGSEHELCYVYAGFTAGTPVADPTEVAAFSWVTPAALTAAVAADPDHYSPWMKLEWTGIVARHLDAIQATVRAG